MILYCFLSIVQILYYSELRLVNMFDFSLSRFVHSSYLLCNSRRLAIFFSASSYESPHQQTAE